MLNTLQKTAAAAAALAAAGTMMIPASASAQSYYGQGYDRYDRSYDQCYRDSRTGAGAVIGGTLGAVAGSQLAARGRRTEGSILGGVLGAVVGGAAGRDSSRYCDDRYQSGYNYDRDDRYQDNAYYGRDYDDRYYDNRDDRGGSYYSGQQSYYSGGQQPHYSGGYGYQGGSYDRGYSDRYYSSDRYGSGYSQSCRTVQSTTRDRYGRTVTHYREVC